MLTSRKSNDTTHIFWLGSLGRVTAHDVAAFAQDSTVTPMTTLDPSDFPNRVVLSRDPWFVDFFAPVSVHIVLTVLFESMLMY